MEGDCYLRNVDFAWDNLLTKSEHEQHWTASIECALCNEECRPMIPTCCTDPDTPAWPETLYVSLQYLRFCCTPFDIKYNLPMDFELHLFRSNETTRGVGQEDYWYWEGCGVIRNFVPGFDYCFSMRIIPHLCELYACDFNMVAGEFDQLESCWEVSPFNQRDPPMLGKNCYRVFANWVEAGYVRQDCRDMQIESAPTTCQPDPEDPGVWQSHNWWCCNPPMIAFIHASYNPDHENNCLSHVHVLITG
jgi:hypothetical protein